jgi:hypothetical protein
MTTLLELPIALIAICNEVPEVIVGLWFLFIAITMSTKQKLYLDGKQLR